ncbi:MAG: phosphopentomutase [bacterium]|nr:phosphopentomutase [bacterium]
MFKRVALIILDSVGIGALPDAKQYRDDGCNTLGNIANHLQGLNLPNLESLGLGLIANIKGIKNNIASKASYGKMGERSAGKDSTIGHWEIAGLITKKPFPVFPKGFPDKIVKEFTAKTGFEILGNYPASGTEIIKHLGEEHLKTKKPIVYTSADSVFQIAAHEEIIPLDKLYRICEITREILNPYQVGRVIARPFIGEPSFFVRTKNRKDFSLKPPSDTLLNILEKNNINILGIGKIKDLFGGSGIKNCLSTENNHDGIHKIIDALKKVKEGLIFTNLIDFDMIYGHRNDIFGYAKALLEFDNHIPEIFTCLNDDDLLIITADHGCDPTFKGTDHTREYVPLLVYTKRYFSGRNLGIRESFADVGQTIAEIFNVTSLKNGKSFLNMILG